MRARPFAAFLLAVLLPLTASAFPFGGMIFQVIPCFNNVQFAVIGPPVGGAYIWIPGVTKTYLFGPPTHTGQWLLGLTSIPYYCLVSPFPLITVPGISILMMGSSQ